jgi:hypothetical protein
MEGKDMTSEVVMKKSNNGTSLSKQPKYYEADGALRAYANRNFILAVCSGLLAVLCLIGFLFVRFQPPTVIRVLPTGEASVVSSDGTIKSTTSPAVLRSISQSEAPSQYEKEAYVRTFLENFLNYDEHTLGQNWSHALNMMSGNLRIGYLAKYQKENTVGNFQSEHVRSVWKVSHLEVSPNDPLTYNVNGVRTVHRMAGGQQEYVDQIVEAYQVRLAESDRTQLDPSGLLISQIGQQQIHSESKTVASMKGDAEGGDSN